MAYFENINIKDLLQEDEDYSFPPFTDKDLEEIEKAIGENRIEEIIMPVDKAFEVYEKINLSERITGLYKNGVKLRPQQVGKSEADEEIYRVYGFDGEFIGTGRFINGEFRSHKNFC